MSLQYGLSSLPFFAAGSDGKYANTAAHADLWCGPGAAKVAIKHFFSDPSSKTEVKASPLTRARHLQACKPLICAYCTYCHLHSLYSVWHHASQDCTTCSPSSLLVQRCALQRQLAWLQPHASLHHEIPSGFPVYVMSSQKSTGVFAEDVANLAGRVTNSPTRNLKLYVYTQAFLGGKPSFEAVDGSGIAVGAKVQTTDATGQRNGDGGFGSVGDVLLKIAGQGTFR